MDFLCYLHEGWKPLIRPASPTRPWMDNTPEAFAYRCLPLNIANAHGWEILTPSGFTAYWRGGATTADVIIRPDKDMPSASAPVSLFGQGTFTIHIQALFRTPPGWNLMIGGSPNSPKEGVSPLSGVIETDWSPYTFTMNWKFTRRNHWVRFEAGEAICFVQPTPRGALECMDPKFIPLDNNPDAARQFAEWSQSRNEFQAAVAEAPPASTSMQWQKRYYRGLDMDDKAGVPDHEAKLRLKPFVEGAAVAAAPSVSVNPDLLETAIAALAASVRADSGFDGRLLTEAGLPPATAERIVAAARAGRVSVSL